ncbi:MAG: hypothetical protein ACR2KG_09640 [Nocardioidaceae bacterium]
MVSTNTLNRIRAAAALVLLEGLAAAVMGVFELVQLRPAHPSVGVTSAIFFLLYAAGLVLSARGLARLRNWSRGPVVLAQLIQLGVAWSFHGNNTTWVAVLLAVPAAVVLFVVFSPPTTVALYGHRASTDPNGADRAGADDEEGQT